MTYDSMDACWRVPPPLLQRMSSRCWTPSFARVWTDRTAASSMTHSATRVPPGTVGCTRRITQLRERFRAWRAKAMPILG